MTVVSTDMAQEKFSEWLDQVARTGEAVFICREGKPVARLERWHGELLAERRRRAATGEEKSLPWEEAAKLLAKELP